MILLLQLDLTVFILDHFDERDLKLSVSHQDPKRNKTMRLKLRGDIMLTDGGVLFKGLKEDQIRTQ